MSATTDQAEYRQLLQEFERRNADYQKRLEAYREAGEENTELKTQLEQEFSEIDSLSSGSTNSAARLRGRATHRPRSCGVLGTT